MIVLRHVRQPWLRGWAVVAVLSTSAILAACGGEADGRAEPQDQSPTLTHAQYQQAIMRILRSDDTRDASRLFTEAVATEDASKACEERVRGLHDSLRSILGQVEALRPPPDAADAQRDFLTAAQESVGLVGAAADDVAEGDLTCGQRLNRRIYGLPSTQRAETALARLKERGYFVFGE
jgi:hypothetical protein